MEFNACKVLRFGKLNQGRSYAVNGRWSVVDQQDLGVQVQFPKSGGTVDRVMEKAFGMLVLSVGIGVGTSCHNWASNW